MNQKEKMRKDIFEDINSHFKHFFYLKDLLAVFDHISRMHIDKNEEIKLQKAPEFFNITEAALIDSFLLTIARLYDNSTDAMTIQTLINKCKKNSEIISDDLSINNKLDEFTNIIYNDAKISSTINIIKHRRDKILVHNDKGYFNNPEKGSAHLSMYDIWNLTSFTEKVLDYLLTFFPLHSIEKAKYDNDLNNLFS